MIDVKPSPKQRRDATRQAALEILSDLEFGELCNVVGAAFEARPDINKINLTDLSNKLGRLGW